MHPTSNLNICSNVRITAVDPSGRVVYEHIGHNIWLDQGRTWLMSLMGYDTTGYVPVSPPVAPPGPYVDPEPNPVGAPYTRDVTAPIATTAGVYMPWRPFYIGLGVGGNQQSGPVPADVDTDYPGTNVQSDADPTVTGLERAVRVCRVGMPIPAPPNAWCRWLQPVAVSYAGATPYTYVRYTATFSASDINTDTRVNGIAPYDFAAMPLSEAALYPWHETAPGTSAADFENVTYPLPFVGGQALAYETFPVLNKTAVLAVIVQWDIICV